MKRVLSGLSGLGLVFALSMGLAAEEFDLTGCINKVNAAVSARKTKCYKVCDDTNAACVKNAGSNDKLLKACAAKVESCKGAGTKAKPGCEKVAEDEATAGQAKCQKDAIEWNKNHGSKKSNIDASNTMSGSNQPTNNATTTTQPKR